MIERRRRVKQHVAIVIAVGCLVLTQFGANAQEGYPVVPDPSECQIAPRTVDEVKALISNATPVAEPERVLSVEVPLGTEADLAAIEGVTATIHEAFACLNGNQFLSFFSLLTDPALTTNFYWVGEMLAGDEVPAEFLDPQPLAAEYQQTLISISGISRLTQDGRVGAFVVSVDPSSGSLEPTVMFLILTLIDDRWLVDEVIEFHS